MKAAPPPTPSNISASGLVDAVVTGITRTAGAAATNVGQTFERGAQPDQFGLGQIVGAPVRALGRGLQSVGGWLSSAQPTGAGKETGQAISDLTSPITAPVRSAFSAVDKAQRGALGNEKAEAAETLESMFGPGVLGQAIGATGRTVGALRDIGSGIEEGHPLTVAAKSAQANLDEASQAARDQGLKLPGRSVSPAQQYMDNAARRDLNLPGNAPVTSDLIDEAVKKNALPAFAAARRVPEYQLSPQYEAAIKGIDLTKIDPAYVPPTSGTMDGARAVDLSQNLRSEARGYFSDAENLDSFADRKLARQKGQAAYQAAKAVESGFREAAPTDIADGWEAARPYVAKAASWSNALDGAGHVIGPKIRKLMLNDEPISGPLKEAASVAAQYPELFRSTRLSTPQPSLAQRVVKGVAPLAGAGVGGYVGGPWGAAGGTALGAHAAEKLVGPQ
jgi:hypothetical protein